MSIFMYNHQMFKSDHLNLKLYQFFNGLLAIVYNMPIRCNYGLPGIYSKYFGRSFLFVKFLWILVQVQLTEFNPYTLDLSVLWTESKDLGDGFHAVRMVDNIKLNIDASIGDTGIHDGTEILLWEWNKNDNQRWKTEPFCKFFNMHKPLYINVNDY